MTDLRHSDIGSRFARIVSPDASVEEVRRMVEPGRDVFVLSDNESLISRWDFDEAVEGRGLSLSA